MDDFIGSLIINVGFFAAAAYIPLQLFTAIKWKGGWRWLALLPLLAMLPVVALTIVGFVQEKNLWPLMLIFASPFASLYLVILMILHHVTYRGVAATTAKQ